MRPGILNRDLLHLYIYMYRYMHTYIHTYTYIGTQNQDTCIGGRSSSSNYAQQSLVSEASSCSLGKPPCRSSCSVLVDPVRSSFTTVDLKLDRPFCTNGMSRHLHGVEHYFEGSAREKWAWLARDGHLELNLL